MQSIALYTKDSEYSTANRIYDIHYDMISNTSKQLNYKGYGIIKYISNGIESLLFGCIYVLKPDMYNYLIRITKNKDSYIILYSSRCAHIISVFDKDEHEYFVQLFDEGQISLLIDVLKHRKVTITSAIRNIACDTKAITHTKSVIYSTC